MIVKWVRCSSNDAFEIDCTDVGKLHNLSCKMFTVLLISNGNF